MKRTPPRDSTGRKAERRESSGARDTHDVQLCGRCCRAVGRPPESPRRNGTRAVADSEEEQQGELAFPSGGTGTSPRVGESSCWGTCLAGRSGTDRAAVRG